MRTGLEVLLERGLPELEGKRVGLITNHTGVDSQLRSSVDLLRQCDWLQLVALFGPEHGVRGAAQAGAKVASTTDERTGLPVHSLYGKSHKPTQDMLRGLGALVYDIQDVGVRYATYLSTLFNCQEAAAENDILFVVLDRPNPLGGLSVQGNMLEPHFRSFVGTWQIPIQHAMTAGELAGLFASENGWPAPIVVAMEGWRRDMWFEDTGLPWVLPSPNMPTLVCNLLYPGTCLVEGTNLSEGRGTTLPFELLGAPWLDPFALADDLNRQGLPGVRFRPSYFTPMFSKHSGESCAGVQVHVANQSAVQTPELGIYLLHAFRQHSGERFEWLGSGESYFVDRLLGSDEPRRLMDAGASVDEITGGWEAQRAAFVGRREQHLLYE